MVAQERDIQLITNIDTLRDLCVQAMIQHPEEVQVYHKGGKFKTKMEKLFIGKVMNVTKGNAHPERLRDIVVECLSSSLSSSIMSHPYR
jgi:aspartyl-tRNA(Asn)/glutamyl-tRNA(Gln) amidotransferase subunit B